jgi:predicted RNA binding protein YcfA (HicA-like mRNA interferase family)
MSPQLPAITGIQLIHLLEKDDWVLGRRTKHGRSMTKKVSERTLVTIIPEVKVSLPTGTLMATLGPKQTQLGREGLLNLINKYGL